MQLMAKLNFTKYPVNWDYCFKKRNAQFDILFLLQKLKIKYYEYLF